MLDQETFLNRLAGFLARASGAQVAITAALPLAGGASRDSWRIDCTLDGAPRSFVLRRDPPTQMFADALSRADEYRLMAAAHAAGVCVAAVRYLCEDPEVLGGAFFLMDLVEGVSIGRTVVHAPELAAARTRLADEMAQQLALIHRMPADTLGFLPAPADGSPAASAIAGCYRMLIALGIEHPVFEYALRWLALHRPAEERIATLHGDFRIGNMLVGSPGLTAVIDWEFAHLGDPHEELGYGCLRDWRFGGALPYGGIATRERFIAAYEAAGGGPVNRDSMRWWEILGNVRWGIICLSQAERHLSGAERSVELASLGRRSAEMQLEALRLIHDAGLGGRETMYDRPDLAELIEAAREHIETALLPLAKAQNRRVYFQTLVAVNVLRIAGREAEAGAAPTRDAWHRLNALLGSEPMPTDRDAWPAALRQRNERLCGMIRAGRFDGDPALYEHLVATTLDQLAVANPRFLADLAQEDALSAG